MFPPVSAAAASKSILTMALSSTAKSIPYAVSAAIRTVGVWVTHCFPNTTKRISI